jgi:hypothetical protein
LQEASSFGQSSKGADASIDANPPTSTPIGFDVGTASPTPAYMSLHQVDLSRLEDDASFEHTGEQVKLEWISTDVNVDKAADSTRRSIPRAPSQATRGGPLSRLMDTVRDWSTPMPSNHSTQGGQPQLIVHKPKSSRVGVLSSNDSPQSGHAVKTNNNNSSAGPRKISIRGTTRFLQGQDDDIGGFMRTLEV